jgi:putative endonuclease
MEHFLYLLKSEVKETYYTGISKDPEQRLFFHNNSDRKKHTLRYRPWKLVYTHKFTTKEEALAAETKVKSWKSKKMIRLLIEGEIDIKDYL